MRRALVRAAIVPSLAALFPALHYVNRNVASERLPPRVEPTPTALALALAAAVAGSAAFGLLVSAAGRAGADEPGGSRLDRAFSPDNRSLAVLAVLVSLAFAWAIVAVADVGPDWLGTALSIPAGLVGLPLLLLAPLAIRSHLAVVVGYACSAVWVAVLSTAVVDAIERRLDRGRVDAGG